MAPMISAALLLSGALGAAQDSARRLPAPAIAIVGATVVPMDSDRVLPNRTVLVENGRIIAVGPADSLAVPRGATVIDARGRYLVPGLADMHMHLTTQVGARPEFGDAPLYLANGVTTVLNLRGDSLQLAWRARVRDGSLLGPTLYTAGEFVNEPRVNTPEEAEREVRAQAAAGFDVIKFREVLDLNKGAVLTTHGLSRETYHRMMETARAVPIPLIGHAPNNLGLEAALEERQSMAHTGYNLMASYFWPAQTARFRAHRRAGQWLLIALAAVVVLGWGTVAGAAIRRRPDLARPLAGMAALATAVLAVGLVGARELFKPDGIGHPSHVTAVTAAGLALGIGAVALLWRAFVTWRRSALLVARLYSAAAAALVLLLVGSALSYWVPLVRRSGERGLADLAEKIARSGIWVTTTLQVYRSDEVADNPEMRYVSIPPWWQRFRANAPPGRRVWARDLLAFLEKVVGALHREKVPLLAGTDAMGWAYVVPGFSLQDELGLMLAAGLSPYEVLRTATVAPARFLQVPDEFGTVAPGRRADLVLVERNPLQDLSTLRKPLGVMVRGRWLPAAELQAMLARLAADPGRNPPARGDAPPRPVR